MKGLILAGIETTDSAVMTRPEKAAGSLRPLPTHDALPRRFSDFATMGEALDYAASGTRGFNFHDARGNLARPYPYSELRADALACAYRLIAHGIKPEDRIALVAETGVEFAQMFFGVIYAGAWPVPLPLPTSFGGKESYIDQLSVQLSSCDPKILFFPAELAEMAGEAARLNKVEGLAFEDFIAREAVPCRLPQAHTDEIAYLQYSSGSTRFPHGVAVTHKALLSNLSAHSHGMELQDSDRCISWLPWYHDMGLVGCFLSPVANQVSTDYMKTEDFARRPLAWLDLISRNEGTTISYSPTFGYDICARRMSSQTKASDRFDLSRWRLAGNGADMIRPDVMQSFVDAFADAGFKPSAFLPSYGLAEATLAVTIMPPGEGIMVELVEETDLSGGDAAEGRPQRYRAIVNCGKPVKDMVVEIRDEDGSLLGEGQIGKVWTTGPSLMVGYFRDRRGDCRLHGGRLARHRRHGIYVQRLSLYRRPRQGHDHHQRQEPLAAGYRMGGGAAPRLQAGRHRRLRDHHAQWRGGAGSARPLPYLGRYRTRQAARPDPRPGSRHHRHELRGGTRTAAYPAAHLIGQIEPLQGAQALS
jgi:fatty-acyl-CoA synthase